MLSQELAMKDSNSGSVIGRIHSIESFGSVDGPGIRFVIFTQG
ncbi:MAG: pyruvate formate lyase 1-activating protein, partial [Lachnospiraceae bacterium]|nr:pyruvate formate lyase 1-activating protein [Lachnospiraceae bacterium]